MRRYIGLSRNTSSSAISVPSSASPSSSPAATSRPSVWPCVPSAHRRPQLAPAARERTPPRTPRSRSTAASSYSDRAPRAARPWYGSRPGNGSSSSPASTTADPRGEMATLLGLPLATVEAEITEAVSTLTKGNEGRLVARLATAAGEASVPDLTARAKTHAQASTATGEPSSRRPPPSSRSASSRDSSCSSRERCGGTPLWVSRTTRSRRRARRPCR